MACGEAAQHILAHNGKDENGRQRSPKLLACEAAILVDRNQDVPARDLTQGISEYGISSQNIHGLQVQTLARTSLGRKLMKHGISLETDEIVHQTSEYLRPILRAFVSQLSVRSCVVVVLPPLYSRTNCLWSYR